MNSVFPVAATALTVYTIVGFGVGSYQSEQCCRDLRTSVGFGVAWGVLLPLYLFKWSIQGVAYVSVGVWHALKTWWTE